jgi:AcrR family transcriptional regulator
MGHSLIPKEQVLDLLTSAFRRHGKDGASISILETATGLRRNSLYHLFPGGKDEMTSAVLAHAATILYERALKPLQEDGSPNDKLTAMCKALDDFYGSGREPCLVGVLSLGTPDDAIQQQISQAVTGWIALLASVIQQAGIPSDQAVERAEEAVIAIQGALVVSKALGSEHVFKRLMKKLPDDLLRVGGDIETEYGAKG